jgi:hypothetical protein
LDRRAGRCADRPRRSWVVSEGRVRERAKDSQNIRHRGDTPLKHPPCRAGGHAARGGAALQKKDACGASVALAVSRAGASARAQRATRSAQLSVADKERVRAGCGGKGAAEKHERRKQGIHNSGNTNPHQSHRPRRCRSKKNVRSGRRSLPGHPRRSRRGIVHHKPGTGNLKHTRALRRRSHTPARPESDEIGHCMQHTRC